MTQKAADDYSAIAARMKEIAGETVPTAEEPVCAECEGGGWTFSSYQAVGAPNLIECPKCGNPEDLPCP